MSSPDDGDAGSIKARAFERGHATGIREAVLAFDPEVDIGADDAPAEILLERMRDLGTRTRDAANVGIEHLARMRDELDRAQSLPTDEEIDRLRKADPAFAWWMGQIKPEFIRDFLSQFVRARRSTERLVDEEQS